MAYVTDWVSDNTELLRRSILSYGGVLIRGFNNLANATDFDQVLGILTNEPVQYTGGTTPRRSIVGKVVSSTELPPQYSIALHQEMAYLKKAPDGIAFFCQHPAESGGFTTLSDARLVTARLDPGVKERLELGGIVTRRVLPSRNGELRKTGVSKPWADVFGTENREQVHEIARKNNWTIAWGAEDSLALTHEAINALKKHPVTGENVWFNQAHYHAPISMIRWAQRDKRYRQLDYINKYLNDNPEMLNSVSDRSGSQIRNDDIEHIWDVLVAAECQLVWEKGDLLILDNLLSMHGRTSFTGQRQIHAGLIGEFK